MKSIEEIRETFQAATDDRRFLGFGELSNVILMVLDHIETLHSDFTDCGARIDKLEHKDTTVPAQWYRAASHSSAKVYRELLALGEAVDEFDASEPIRKRQREILAADSEYQQLLAEEHTPTIWGKGLEDVSLEVQRALQPEDRTLVKLHRQMQPPNIDYTKPHPFDLEKETGLPHVEYRICKCGMSEANKAIHPY